jgi:hypothetical protein
MMRVCTRAKCSRLLELNAVNFKPRGISKKDGVTQLFTWECRRCVSLRIRNTQKKTRPTKIDMIQARISSLRPQGDEAKMMIKELKIYVDGLITMGQIRRSIAIKKGTS